MSQELFEAIAQHDTRRLAELLSQGANPNKGHPAAVDWTPLKAAIDELISGGSIDAVVLLLQYRANANGSGPVGDCPPLMAAVLNRRLDAVRILLAAGANPNVRNDDGDSALFQAVLENDLPMASVLLACGAAQNIDEIGPLEFTTSLGLAASNLNVKMVELLLSYGANPDINDSNHAKAYEYLPPRDEANARDWDAIKSLIGPQQYRDFITL
ncbi:MAG TPA: ankyrin repeat domain-containing protein [Planctomycetaceae bacterium]|nr:ankyrin repeat domain-containing protein [Planctomycetaceae bacterium]